MYFFSCKNFLIVFPEICEIDNIITIIVSGSELIVNPRPIITVDLNEVNIPLNLYLNIVISVGGDGINDYMVTAPVVTAIGQ